MGMFYQAYSFVIFPYLFIYLFIYIFNFSFCMIFIYLKNS